MTDKKPSSLQELLEARLKDRKAWTYDADTFLMKGKGGFGKIRIRPAMAEELAVANLKAAAFVQKHAKENGASADPDFYNNAKAIFALNVVCRDAEKDFPAFPTPEWMYKHLTIDELTVLLNLHEQTIKLASPVDVNLDADKVETVVTVLNVLSRDDRLEDKALNEYLAQFDRVILGELLIRASQKVHDVKEELENLKKYVAEHASLPPMVASVELEPDTAKPAPRADVAEVMGIAGLINLAKKKDA